MVMLSCLSWQKKNNVQIGFEASVAGGTPVIKALREGLVANKVLWFAGILNGTTNFIRVKCLRKIPILMMPKTSKI